MSEPAAPQPPAGEPGGGPAPEPAPRAGDAPPPPHPAAPPAPPAPLPPIDPLRRPRERDDEVSSALKAPFLRPLLRVPLKKVAIWAGFLLLLWFLRQFFGVIFLTFVLSYIAATIVALLAARFSSRRVPVVLVFGGLVGAIVGLGFVSVPPLRRNLEHVIQRLSKVQDPKRFVEVQLGAALGQHPEVELMAARHGGLFGAVFGDAARRGDSGLLVYAQSYLEDQGLDELARDWLSAETVKKDLIPLLQGLARGLWGGVLTVLMSLVFSFMIVWDAPRLAAGVEDLKHSRLGDVWREVAPSIATFARLLGRAFEAQTVIACANTTLTALGMWLLGIPPSAIGFLAVIVFLCSFVPIVGVFVSTVPICLVALQEGGLALVVGVIFMVIVAHVVEAYVLNPRIYGAHMKLHPVAVLMVLYVGEHLLGLWGLILGVPLATYVWRHLILGEAEYVYPPLTRALVSAQMVRPSALGEVLLDDAPHAGAGTSPPPQPPR